jgi:hypothetical protein
VTSRYLLVIVAAVTLVAGCASMPKEAANVTGKVYDRAERPSAPNVPDRPTAAWPYTFWLSTPPYPPLILYW